MRPAGERARLKDGVAVPFGLALHDRANLSELLGSVQQLELVDAVLRVQPLLDARAGPEVALHRLLARCDNEHDARDATGGELRHDELDHGGVEDRQELLRDAARDRQEARAQTARRDHAVPDRLHAGLRVCHRVWTA